VKKLGILAGAGRFPVILAEAARKQGKETVVIGLEGSEPSLEKIANAFYQAKSGELERVIGIFNLNDVTEVVMAGKVDRKLALAPENLDARAKQALSRMKDMGDNAILVALAGELASAGIKVEEATQFLKPLLAPSGVLGKCSPDARMQKDIDFGFRLAKETGKLDIGQAIVVKNLSVVAIEALEGTDETIRRAGKLAGHGTVVIKVCKPGQDTRFDLPAVGAGTIRTMKEAGASCLAVEAGRTVFLDKEETIAVADFAGISIVGK